MHLSLMDCAKFHFGVMFTVLSQLPIASITFLYVNRSNQAAAAKFIEDFYGLIAKKSFEHN